MTRVIDAGREEPRRDRDRGAPPEPERPRSSGGPRAAGIKFTFGTNNAGPDDLGDWSYPLEMQKRLDLKWPDMFVPGHQPSRAQRE